MDAEPRPPETIDHFRIESVLGKGGMGVVYRAEDLLLRRSVALKVMRPEHVADERRRARFLKEARTAASLVHPNVATIYEVGEAGGTIFIAMELVRGASLRNVMAEGAIAPDRALRWAHGIARALAAAHAGGIVHRDLKPDNVMILPDDDVKLLDFGIAKALSPASSELEPPTPSGNPEATAPITLEGAVIGTPQYVSPEQARGEPVDMRSDVFSYGVVLYELLTARSPFARPTTQATLQAVVRDAAPSLAFQGARVAADVEAIVERCLAKSSEDRFVSGLELFAAVRDAVDRRERELAPGERRRRAFGRAAIVGALCVALAVGVRVAGSERAGARPSSADVESRNVDAVAAYRESQRAYRDGDLDAMGTALDRAVTLDPSFGSALASRAWQRLLAGASGARADLDAAREVGGALPDEARTRVEALEPVLREPPDFGELRRRTEELVRRAPLDAEVRAQEVYAEILEGDATGAAAEARRVREIAPGFAPAYALEGRALERAGRVDEALGAYEDCTRTAPGALLCREWRAQLLAETGDCESLAEEAGRIVTAAPAVMAGYEHRFNALVATGADDRALDDAARSWIAAAPAPLGALESLRVADARALAVGDFHDVLARDTEALRVLATSAEREPRATHAAAVACARDESELGGQGPDAGAVPTGAHDADAWIARARTAVTPEQARAALEERPPGPMLHDHVHEAVLGELARLLGRYDEAVPRLRRASRACLWSRDAETIVTATMQLGAACASAGDAACACDAYARVTARWGAARPRSKSAEIARARALALGCKTPSIP